MRIDLELHALGNSGRAGLEVGMEKYAAVAGSVALEPQREMEIFILLFGPEIAVLLRDPLAVDGSILHLPFLVADLHPSGEILVVKQRLPAGYILLRPGSPGLLKSIDDRGRSQKKCKKRIAHPSNLPDLKRLSH